jgi:hypothetical protein
MPELPVGVYPADYAGWFLGALVFEMIGLVSAFICVHLRLNLMVWFFDHGFHGLTRIRKRLAECLVLSVSIRVIRG